MQNHNQIERGVIAKVRGEEMSAAQRLLPVAGREQPQQITCEINTLLAGRVRITFELQIDRKSTRLNSSHLVISYAVFCLKKKKTPTSPTRTYHFSPSTVSLTPTRIYVALFSPRPRSDAFTATHLIRCYHSASASVLPAVN